MTTASGPDQRATIVVDLGFGDAGKGTVTDAVADVSNAKLVVRFNGGAQAGHNVVTDDGRHHTFSQFGSASFQPGVRTLLTRHVVFHPLALETEAEHLASVGVSDAVERLFVDRRALVTTPYHQIANRLREVIRKDARHGSVGIGVGETMRHARQRPEGALRAGELDQGTALTQKLAATRDAVRGFVEPWRRELKLEPLAVQELEMLDDVDLLDDVAAAFGSIGDRLDLVSPDDVSRIINREHSLIMEGAQGVLLDEWAGFHPYTTWSTTSFCNAMETLDEASFSGERFKLGLTRTYAVRHGPGPFVTESTELDALPEAHNRLHDWQGRLRRGWYDLVMLRYAIEFCGGLDGLAITHLDVLAERDSWRICQAYQMPEAAQRLGAQPSANDPTRFERICPPRSHDLSSQGLLTEVLGRASALLGPSLTTPVSPEATRAWAREHLADPLAVPLVLTSAGPKRHAKCVLGPFWSPRP